MAFVGNLLWFTFGGFFTGTLWMLAGLLMCCTVVGLPIGIACFRIGRFAYFPFGKELVPAEWMGEKRILGTGLMQFFWIILPGWMLALGNALLGVAFCCTIIGIPWAIAYFHLSQASFAPLGKRVVAKAYAKVLQQKFYEKKANEALGMGREGTAVIVNNGSSIVSPDGEGRSPFQNNGVNENLVQFSSSPVPPVSNSPKEKLGNSWFWGLLVVLLVVLVCAGWWFGAGRGRGGSEPTEDFFPVDKSVPKVKPVLTLRPETTYSMTFGGRVLPDVYSFSSSSCIPSYANLAGNPIYFMQPINVIWSCDKASPGGQHIFRRNDEYIVDSPIRDDAWSMLSVSLADIIRSGQARGERCYSSYNVQSTTGYALALRTNALHLGSVFPAPVVMADNAVDNKFCYLNDFGRPSVLIWGIPTNCLFECIEGEEALAGYARSLRELRQVVAESKNEGLRTYTQVLDLRTLPEIFIGDLDAGTREKASVSYEIYVEDFQYTIMEIAECNQWRYSRSWTPELLDEELAFFARFETEASTEKAFEPLYCYLSQRKIMIEAGNEMNRSGESGKKTQQLTFNPIGKQTTTSRVELSATAESGGAVVFSVNNHLGKIEGHTLSFTGTGTVCVAALQWGNDTWRFAKEVECVEIVKTPQTVDFFPIGPQEQTAQVKLSATSDSGNDVSFRVISGPGRISNGVLTFYGSGPVEVMATANEDDIWEKAFATQTVEVNNSEEPAYPLSTPGGATVTGATPPDGGIMPEFATLEEALKTARDNPTGANYKKLEAVWSALPDEQKAATAKNVLWAYCAMLASKGHLRAASKWKGKIDWQAFLRAVSDSCHDCGGRGRIQETCRTCGGSGRKRVRCSNCNGTGGCSFCHGSGHVGGVFGGSPARCPRCGGSGRCKTCSGGWKEGLCGDCGGRSRSSVCRTCNGEGRIVEEDKCSRVVQENLGAALCICRGETPVSGPTVRDDPWGSW